MSGRGFGAVGELERSVEHDARRRKSPSAVVIRLVQIKTAWRFPGCIPNTALIAPYSKAPQKEGAEWIFATPPPVVVLYTGDCTRKNGARASARAPHVHSVSDLHAEIELTAVVVEGARLRRIVGVVLQDRVVQVQRIERQ